MGCGPEESRAKAVESGLLVEADQQLYAEACKISTCLFGRHGQSPISPGQLPETMAVGASRGPFKILGSDLWS